MVERNASGIGYGRPMSRPLAPSPERDSIFGDTYGGVPSPFIMHRHPYPTRYHGMSLTVPQPGYRYQPATYAVAPFLGLGGDEPASVLSSWRAPLVGRTFDTFIGAAIGFASAPTERAAPIHAILGALAAWGVGALGIVGLLAGEIIVNQKHAGLRPDMRALRGGL